MSQEHTAGVYHLILRLPEARALRIGRLGRFTFPAGCYVYTGSAMNGLERRLHRHRRHCKRLWWHIDHLLRAAELEGTVVIPTRRKIECGCNRQVLALPGAEVIAPGFGSSDCRCRTHLVYFAQRPESLGARMALPLLTARRCPQA